MGFHFYMEAKLGPLEEEVKTIDISEDEMFQKNSQICPLFSPQREC